ncbi:MAG: GDP-mannose 4,6-dehydratase [Acidobacteria bacterium]|nr:GDP-mannose 4,6-dehydratase [Acidobacteriota bacterium]
MADVTLVTGAAGFAGSHLLDLLRDGPGEVVAWHRPGGAPASVGGVQWEAIDLLDASAVRDAIARRRPTAVYHCAGAAHVGRSWDNTAFTFAINVRGTHHLLDALERAGVTARVLIPGSALIYAPADRALVETDPLKPASPYGLSKLAQEMLGWRAGRRIRTLIARAFNHFGPRQDPMFVASGFARRIADIERGFWAPEISVGNLEARRDLTDVRDTVRAYRLILERGEPGRPYNVCTGRAVAIRDLLDMLIARARVPLTVIVDPKRYRPNDAPLLLGDPARLRDDLGWSPRIPIEQTLDDLLAYWRARPA